MRLCRVIAVILFALSGACERAPTPVPAAEHLVDAAPQKTVVLATTAVTLKDHAFVLEVARTDQEQETGLMYRTTMPADRGMLFVFADARPRAFWMKNTRIALDIAYLDADGFVVNVEPMFPLDLRGVPSAAPGEIRDRAQPGHRRPDRAAGGRSRRAARRRAVDPAPPPRDRRGR